MATNPSYGRRDFLKDSVVSTVKAAQELVKHAEASSVEAVVPSIRPDWLRPPGAIAVHPASGTPILYADQSPCLLCEDFPCITACRTDALVPVSGITQVQMGTAEVSHRLCTAGQGCHACVSKCPTNALALDVALLHLSVSREVCVGCGMCEMICKTVNDRVAIRVIPARQAARIAQ
jgi:ferredoxin-type protein NapG